MYSFAVPVFRYISIIAAVVFGVFVYVQPAHADPHAVFYTSTGQQQLFFNVLAALDQADYVESSGLPPCPQGADVLPDGSPCANAATRQELSEKRTEAGFPENTDPRVTATKTGLANLVTRNVTLDGADLWTQYILHQNSLEVARRNDADKVIKALCQVAFGRPDCEDELDDPQQALKMQKEAFEVDELEVARTPVERGAFAALLSGQEGTQQQIEDTLKEDGSQPKQPIAYDENVSKWWKAAESAGQTALNYASGGIVGAMANYITPKLESTIWEVIDFSNPDKPQIAGTTSSDPSLAPTLHDHGSVIAALLDNHAALVTAAETGEQRVGQQTLGANQDGAVPNVELKPQQATQGDKYGEVTSIVTTPAHAKVSAGAQGIATVGTTAQNRKFATTDADTNAGTETNVPRPNEDVGDVAGTSTRSKNESATPKTTTPAVLGTVAAETTASSTAPNTNAAGFDQEEGPQKLYAALGYDPEAGCGCSADVSTNDYGQFVLEYINDLTGI